MGAFSPKLRVTCSGITRCYKRRSVNSREMSNRGCELNACLKTTGFRMISTSSEQAWRFNTEVSNLFLTTIDNGIKIWFFDHCFFVFDFLCTVKKNGY
jgi:hypothetical protein